MQYRITCPCGARVRWAVFRRTVAKDVVAANLEAVKAELIASCPICSSAPVAHEGNGVPSSSREAPKAHVGEAGRTQGPNKRARPTKRKGPGKTKRKGSRHAAK